MRTLTLAIPACVVALFVTAARAADPLTLDVWPGGKVPGKAAPAGDEKWDGKKVTNVSRPTLTVFRPDKDKDAGVAVIAIGVRAGAVVLHKEESPSLEAEQSVVLIVRHRRRLAASTSRNNPF